VAAWELLVSGKHAGGQKIKL